MQVDYANGEMGPFIPPLCHMPHYQPWAVIYQSYWANNESILHLDPNSDHTSPLGGFWSPKASKERWGNLLSIQFISYPSNMYGLNNLKYCAFTTKHIYICGGSLHLKAFTSTCLKMWNDPYLRRLSFFTGPCSLFLCTWIQTLYPTWNWWPS